MSGAVFPLHGSQADAVDPMETVWLSASAGTGKTQVLSARVLRLLLQADVDPSQILCLTFTKAGAAEMAVRISDVLARWVRLGDAELAVDLKNIGARSDPETRAHARTLFAAVLDCPGGGLKINTIHAFSQWLLASFPEEAGLTAGTRAMEDRDRDLLLREVLSDLLLDAEKHKDHETLAAIADFSLKKGPDAVAPWLMRCAGAMHLWRGPQEWKAPLRPRVNRLLGLETDACRDDAQALCADDAFDIASLRRCLEAQASWDTKTGRETAAAIGAWIAADGPGRAATMDDLRKAIVTGGGAPRSLAAMEKIDPAYGDYWARVMDSICRVDDFFALLDVAEFLAPALRLGRKFALLWDAAKLREGFIDFDDQIRLAAQLLSRKGLSDWICYKLDRRFDHILIDEAQDTNEDQWQIIFALIDDFFAGEGAHGNKLRTVFTVGDYKQAIFRFQGTSPENFESAKQRVRRQMEAAARNARELRSNHRPRDLQELGLGQSFRTAHNILQFVDETIGSIGHAELGLKLPPQPHIGQDRPGLVALWPVILPGADDGDGDDGSSYNADDNDDNAAEKEGWIARHDRRLADKIAAQVKHWMDHGYPLVKGQKRLAGPGDIMVLVRKRKELAGLIVARLHAAGVAVAGVDRLRLGGPLAVKDLMAALRFAAQPFDDLNLANLLASPLIGWSQEQLLEHCWRERKMPLWPHLRASGHVDVVAARAMLGDLLALADFDPPQALLQWMLVGPWQARSKLVARLGREASDPIDELVNAALAFSASHTPSLQGFLQWFDAGDGELKREAEGAGDQLRVMTVHGAKGLQAPIVILADAAGNPKSTPKIELVEPAVGQGKGPQVPLPPLSKAERRGPILEAELAATQEELQEHWRLLYVAMTRAEEALFIGGALGPAEAKKGPAENSWYARLKPLFGDVPVADDIWGQRFEWGAPRAATGPADKGTPKAQGAIARKDAARPAVAVPDWAVRPVGPEPRPPRPLAPSAAGEDLAPDPPMPAGAGRMDAARRGTLIHKMLERLPAVAPRDRREQAMAWLARAADDVPEPGLAEMVDAALGVLENPEWSDLFGPASMAEVPFAATVGGQVIAGTVDRLLVLADRVLVVDFKTARRPPRSAQDIPASTISQMAAYHAALRVIYPDRTVEIAVLYTHSPQLFAIGADQMAPHKVV